MYISSDCKEVTPAAKPRKRAYKSASFVIQAICFKQSGKYIRHQKELREFVSQQEQDIIDTFPDLKTGATIDFDEMSERLFNWVKMKIQ